MYYIYQLSYNASPFYIGMSVDPVKLYMQHCSGFGCTVRSYINSKIETGEFPDLSILAHCEDKYEAMFLEAEAINSETSNQTFLVNSDHNTLDNLLIFKEIDLKVGWGFKLPKRYDTEIRIHFNEYIKAHKINRELYKIHSTPETVSDFAIAKSIVRSYNLHQEGFVNPKVVGNFRKYLRDET